MSAQTNLLARPINVFSIPPELLSSLAVRTIQDDALPDESAKATPQAGSSKAKRVEQTSTSASLTPLGSLRCQTCPNTAFDSPEDQREHFTSDWHRYNAKARLTGRAVTVEEWDEMVDGISSISGSASSSSSGSSHSQNQTSQSKVTRLLARQQIDSGAPSENSEEAEMADYRRRAVLRTAIIWYQPSTSLDRLGVPTDTQFGVYRALLPPFEDNSQYMDGLKALQLPPTAPTDDDDERRITLLMVAGGHFAGMVVGLRPLGKSERQGVKGAGEVRVLKHKTFHRYTTRRKQGGSQGLNDNAKSKANSAGAMLRRYGEQALQDDIRALMTEWEEDIESSEKVFIRASTHGKRSFWGYDGAVLSKSDERIRVFPFPTRRPTLQELLRCWHELTRVKVSHLSQQALAALDEAYIKSLQPRTQPQPVKPVPAPAPAPVVPKPSPEEEARRDRLRRIDEMIRKGRLEPLQAFYERHEEDFTIEHLGTAAATGQEDLVRFFLLSTTLDPATPLESGKWAYDLSSSKGVRNVFRRVAFEHPEKYDWAAAHVPSGLSEEAEAAQEKKKVERRKGLREKMKERQVAQAQTNEGSVDGDALEPETVVPPPESKGPQRLGGARAGTGDGLAGLSGDMRAQIERERRARAAEARFKTSA